MKKFCLIFFIILIIDSASAETKTFGFKLPLSGSAAGVGEACKNGVLLAEESSPNPSPVSFIIENDEMTARNLEDGSACLCQPVLLELWNGARGQAEKRFLTELQNSLEILLSNQAAWGISHQIAKKARGAGLTVPAIDILIFSIAITAKADLIHDDSHFESLVRLVK